MNVPSMIAELNRLCLEWEHNRAAPELMDKGEWVRGVVYGIKLAIRIVNDHSAVSHAVRS